MSPAQALKDPDFRLFAIIIAAALAFAAAVLALLTFALRKNVTKLWTIWRGWMVMAPLALAALFAGRIPFIIGVAVVAMFSFKEYARATGLYRDWAMTV